MVIGVDIDSYHLHLCGISGDEPPRVVSVPLRKRGDDEHSAVLAVATSFAVGARTIRDDPVVSNLAAMLPVESVWVERGYGPNRNADFVLGAIYGATFIAAHNTLPNAAVRPMLASSWKKHVTAETGITTKGGGAGNGNASKLMANRACMDIWHARWPLAIIPTDPNQLDAFGVALAGAAR